MANRCTIFILKIILHIKYVTNYRTYITTIQEEKKNDFYICRDNDCRNCIRHWCCGMGQKRDKKIRGRREERATAGVSLLPNYFQKIFFSMNFLGILYV